ncbi:ParB-like nuclease domain [Serratia fonticola]|nr:ParB-like nuclease domain [Serratia fonticola]
MRKQNHRQIPPGHPGRYSVGGFFILFCVSLLATRKISTDDLFAMVLVGSFPRRAFGEAAENSIGRWAAAGSWSYWRPFIPTDSHDEYEPRPTCSRERGHLIGSSEMTKEKNQEKLAIVYKPVDSLIVYARNARLHSDEQVKKLADSIQEFGWTNPVLIDEFGEIIAGHGRIMAADVLMMTDVPCIILSGLTDPQKKAYRLADNKLPLHAGWDEELLKIELTDLLDRGFDVDLTGFTETEVDTLLEDVSEISFDREEDSAGVDINYLSFSRKRIPLTEIEEAGLLRALDDYVDENGSYFGFVSSLIGGRDDA